jgi:hypothetical protein
LPILVAGSPFTTLPIGSSMTESEKKVKKRVVETVDAMSQLDYAIINIITTPSKKLSAVRYRYVECADEAI